MYLTVSDRQQCVFHWAHASVGDLIANEPCSYIGLTRLMYSLLICLSIVVSIILQCP